MNRAEGNGFKATPVIEPVIEEDLTKSNHTAEVAQNGSAKQPYVPGKGKQKAITERQCPGAGDRRWNRTRSPLARRCRHSTQATGDKQESRHRQAAAGAETS